MGDEKRPEVTDGQYPFPSRKDIHGSRIPKSQNGPTDPEETRVGGPSLRESIAPKRQVHDLPSHAAHETPKAADAFQPVRVGAHRSASPERTGSTAPSATTPRPKRTENVAPNAAKKAKQRKRHRRVRTTLILLFLVAVISVAVWFAVESIRNGGPGIDSDDYPGPGHGSVEVTVDPGDTGTDMATHLYDAGVVKSQGAFVRAFRNNAAASTIKPGTFSLKLEMSAAGALAAMLDEANRVDNTVTVNAGQTVSQVRERLIEFAGFTEEQVDSAFANSDAIGLPAVAEGKPEGWLGPGSYEVSSTDTPETVVARMVSTQIQLLKQLEIPEDQWMTVLTKASILEREANNSEDLAKVARVISNRLEDTEAETRGMLQMDSTALYGVGKSGGLPTEADLADDNPYNTYVVKGLPPGPIATPSLAAIEATLNPAEGSWLYFVTINLDTGETVFADTLAEQEANTKLLSEWCAANEGRC